MRGNVSYRAAEKSQIIIPASKGHEAKVRRDMIGLDQAIHCHVQGTPSMLLRAEDNHRRFKCLG